MTRDSTADGGATTFGPHLSHQEAMRRLTALSEKGCKSCARSVVSVSEHTARPFAAPKLRHYPTVPTTLVPGQVPISPPLNPTSPSSPPGSPPGSSFFGSFFGDKSPTPSPSVPFMNKQTPVVPPLSQWNDLHDYDFTP